MARAVEMERNRAIAREINTSLTSPLSAGGARESELAVALGLASFSSLSAFPSLTRESLSDPLAV